MNFLFTLLKKYNINKIAFYTNYSYIKIYLDTNTVIWFSTYKVNDIPHLISNEVKSLLITNNCKESDLINFISEFEMHYVSKFKNNYIEKLVLIDAQANSHKVSSELRQFEFHNDIQTFFDIDLKC